jgi:Zn-dependent peptidase ImmA (M78 family)
MLPKKLEILRKFGRVRLSASDFVIAVDHNRIEVVSSPDVRRGVYYCSGKQHTIVLPTSMAGQERLITAWHEFAHFLQNFYDKKTAAAFCGVQADAPGEKHAEIFARIAVRPEDFGITGPMDFIKMIMRTKL